MKPLISATIAGCLAALTNTAEARSLYDGSWDLVFVTQAASIELLSQERVVVLTSTLP